MAKLANPTIRLAHKEGGQGDNVLLGLKGSESLPADRLPGILVSFFYLKSFMKKRKQYHFRDWVLDSGAFSADNSGVVIDLQSYIDTCLRLTKKDPKLTEVFSLDVIGDWKKSLKNTEKMWKAGVPAIPAYHVGEPWSVLKGLAKDYPKVALGGAVGYHAKKKFAWAEQCFARIWPKRIHGFGFSGEKAVLGLPWHSVDATNWELGPCKFGNWKSFGKLSVRGSNQNLRAEVEWYLKLEERARRRWKKEMKLVNGLTPGPTVRLACEFTGAKDSDGRYAKALGKPGRKRKTK